MAMFSANTPDLYQYNHILLEYILCWYRAIYVAGNKWIDLL
jgi:hypothetical protein